MTLYSATAIAHPNIAFIKYWGNKDETLHLPLNGSLSMCLDGLKTITTVTFDPALQTDILTLDSKSIQGAGLERVQRFLDHVRLLASKQIYAQVESVNNFPSGAGIASSASAFAALALASTHALGLQLTERDLSRLARLGSGSACRSVPGGFVEWQVGESDADSFAFSIAPADHWELVDLIVIVDRGHKSTGSAEGMTRAQTSPHQAQRLADAPNRLAFCRQTILARDFAAFAAVVELDSNWMHAVMQSSQPPLYYWQPATEEILKNVFGWRAEGHAVCATVDAGPNVHVLCLPEEQDFLVSNLNAIPEVQEVIIARPGGSSCILTG